MVIPSGLGERRAACLLVVVRQTRRRGAACGAQTWGHRRHRRVWPASASHRSDRGKRTGGSSKSPPRRACPDVPSTRPRDDLPVPDVERWPSGQPRRMATPRDRRDGSGNLSSLIGYRGGVSWTGVDRANGARQIRRARRRNRRLVRQPPWRGEKRRSPTTSFDVPGIPLPTRAPRELGNATNALVSPAMSANAPDFASFVLPRSGATGALAKRALEGCRDMSRYQFSSGFSMDESSKKSANSELRSQSRLARTSITH